MSKMQKIMEELRAETRYQPANDDADVYCVVIEEILNEF